MALRQEGKAMLELVLIATGTAVATGIGVLPVSLLGERAATLRPALLGLASAVMGVAAVAGLLLAAFDDGVAVLFVHSLPEGLAIGTAYASSTQGLALFIVVAIAVQNIPEGTSVAIPMQAAGYRPWQQFWAAVATSAPQPIGAVIAFVVVEQATALLPVSFAFAAGAMLALVAVEMFPNALRANPAQSLAGAMIGAAAMLALSVVLGV